MNREYVIEKLKAAEPGLRAQGVAALYLFGSHARDEAGEKSDLDLFVDPVRLEAFGLVPLMASRALLEPAFPGVEVSLSTREGIVPSYRAYIEQGAVRVF